MQSELIPSNSVESKSLWQESGHEAHDSIKSNSSSSSIPATAALDSSICKVEDEDVDADEEDEDGIASDEYESGPESVTGAVESGAGAEDSGADAEGSAAEKEDADEVGDEDWLTEAIAAALTAVR